MDLEKLVRLLESHDALEEVRSFIRNNPTKLDVLFVFVIRRQEYFGGTLLHYSCLWNRPKVVSYLLSQNADVAKCFQEYQIVQGRFQGGGYDCLTAQQIAEKRGYVDIVTLFQIEQSKIEQAVREAEALFGNSSTHNSIRLLDAPPSSSLQFSPIYGITDIKVTSLIEAIKPLASTNLVKHIDKYTQDALNLFSKNPLPTPLDLDETVAIHLYTKEWPEHTCSLYYVLNAQLRSEDRCMIKPFFPYIKILLMGLNKLEKTPGVTYRGVGLNLSKDYNIGEEIEWWAFTSTTTDGNACQGFLEKSPEKTLFRLEQKNGVNIQKFSQYPSESEVLLCPMKVLVKNKFKVEGLWMVELEDLGIPLVNL